MKFENRAEDTIAILIIILGILVLIISCFAIEGPSTNLSPTSTTDPYLHGEAVGGGCVRMNIEYIEYLEDLHSTQADYRNHAWYINDKVVGFAIAEDEPIIVCKE